MSQLSYTIKEVQHKEWFLERMLPNLRTPLLQQRRMLTQRDALEFVMQLESYSGLAEASIPGMALGLA